MACGRWWTSILYFLFLLTPTCRILVWYRPLSAYKYTCIRLHREARQLAPFSPLILCVFQVVRPFLTRLLCCSGLSDLCLSMLVFATLITLADVFSSPMPTASASPTSPTFANAYHLSPAIALRDLLAPAPRQYLHFSHLTPLRASSLTRERGLISFEIPFEARTIISREAPFLVVCCIWDSAHPLSLAPSQRIYMHHDKTNNCILTWM